MGIGRFQTLAVQLAVAAGAPFDVSRLGALTLQTTGTFVATMQLQVSHDGTNFETLGADITAPEVREIAGTWRSVRINTSVFTSGTPVVTLGGRDTRTR